MIDHIRKINARRKQFAAAHPILLREIESIIFIAIMMTGVFLDFEKHQFIQLAILFAIGKLRRIEFAKIWNHIRRATT